MGWSRASRILHCEALRLFFQEQVRVLKRDRKTTLILTAIFCALLIAAFIVGISDNIAGIVLCFLAATIPVIAFTYTLRELKKLLTLLGASVGGFFVFVILHNAFYALGVITGHIVILSHLINALGVVCFCIAVFLCPAAFLVGAVGSIALAVRKRKNQAAN